MIFLRRLWKIPWLTTSIRPPSYHVNEIWDTRATIAIFQLRRLVSDFGGRAIHPSDLRA